MTAAKFVAMICLIILIGLLVYYLYRDSIEKNNKGKKITPAKPGKGIFDNRPEELVNAPVLFIRLPGQKNRGKIGFSL